MDGTKLFPNRREGRWEDTFHIGFPTPKPMLVKLPPRIFIPCILHAAIAAISEQARRLRRSETPVIPPRGGAIDSILLLCADPVRGASRGRWSNRPLKRSPPGAKGTPSSGIRRADYMMINYIQFPQLIKGVENVTKGLNGPFAGGPKV